MDPYSTGKTIFIELLSKAGITVTENLVDIITSGISVATTLLFFPLYKYLRQSHILKKSILRNNHYYLESDIRKALNNYISTNFQNIPPSYEQEPLNTHAATARQKLIPFFVNCFEESNTPNKYYIIMADSGMGKTTFLLNLFFTYKIKYFRKFDVFLFPLNQTNIEQEIESIPDDIKSRSIILLDALDEDSKAAANYIDRIDQLMGLTTKFRFVLLTCRTQFFPYEEVEPSEITIQRHGTEGGYHRFKKIYLSPFNEADIRKYLRKRFSIFKVFKRRKAFKIVKASPYLMVRPMLLSYIDDLISAKEALTNIYEIYHYLIEAWIKREVIRKKNSERALFETQLRLFSEKVALRIYSNFRNQSQLSISHHQIVPFADEHQIKLSDLELKSKSLLNRDANGNYKFAHKSILEYFLANKAFSDFQFLKGFEFASFTYVKKLYRGLCLKQIVEKKLYHVYNVTADNYYKSNNVKLKSYDALHIQSLCGLPKVTSIELKNLRLSNDYLHYLKMMDGLLSLNLENNHFSDHEILYQFEHLTSLNLSSNKFEEFKLNKFDKLHFCDLSNNSISIFNIDSASIQSLDLSGNPISEILVIACPEMNSIDLRNTRLVNFPKFSKKVNFRTDEDFNLFLTRSRALYQNSKPGNALLNKIDSSFFNRSFIHPSYLDYAYESNYNKGSNEKVDHILGVDTFKIDQIAKLIEKIHPTPSRFGFIEELKAGLIISIDHTFFSTVELTISDDVIRMKLTLKNKT